MIRNGRMHNLPKKKINNYKLVLKPKAKPFQDSIPAPEISMAVKGEKTIDLIKQKLINKINEAIRGKKKNKINLFKDTDLFIVSKNGEMKDLSVSKRAELIEKAAEKDAREKGKFKTILKNMQEEIQKTLNDKLRKNKQNKK